METGVERHPSEEKENTLAHGSSQKTEEKEEDSCPLLGFHCSTLTFGLQLSAFYSFSATLWRNLISPLPYISFEIF
jgi:hypothetical protein